MSDEISPAEARAFQMVFGVEGRRTQAQKFVWARLMQVSQIEGMCFVAQKQHVQVDGEGRLIPVAQMPYDPIAAAITDGMRRKMIFIKSRVESPAANVDDEA